MDQQGPPSNSAPPRLRMQTKKPPASLSWAVERQRPPAPNGAEGTDTASSTPPITPEEADPIDDTLVADEPPTSEVEPTEPALEPANDNSRAEELPATGTE